VWETCRNNRTLRCIRCLESLIFPRRGGLLVLLLLPPLLWQVPKTFAAWPGWQFLKQRKRTKKAPRSGGGGEEHQRVDCVYTISE